MYDQKMQGFVYELASKLGIVRSLLYLLHKGHVCSGIKGFARHLTVLEGIGEAVLGDKAFEKHKPIVKGFILQSMISFLDDFGKIKECLTEENEDGETAPKIETLYWDDYCSSLKPAQVRTAKYSGDEIPLFEVATDIVWNCLLPKDSVINPYKETIRQGEVEKTDFLLDLSVGKTRALYVIDFKNGTTHSESSESLSEAVTDLYASLLGMLKQDTVLDVVSVKGVEQKSIRDIVKSNFDRVREYFHYFKLMDKYSGKFLQAVSYAHDYISRMGKRGVDYRYIFIKPQVNAVNRLIKLEKDELTALYRLAGKYETPPFAVFLKDYFGDKLPGELIKKFIKGTDVNREIFTSEYGEIRTSETLIGGDNGDYSMLDHDLRRDHTEAVTKILNEGKNLLLTGNPGIGKTYAVIKYMSKQVENGLCLYASPRVAVNLDFASKVVFDEAIKDPYAVVLTTNSRRTNRQSGDDEKKPISYIDIYAGDKMTGIVDELNRRVEEKGKRIRFADARNLHAGEVDFEDALKFEVVGETDDFGVRTQTIKDRPDKKTVNSAILDALEEVMDFLNDSNTQKKKIYILMTIQALKHNTGQFFRNLSEKLEDRIKRAVLFIDEVTGDPSGIGVAKEMMDVFGDEESVSLVIGDASLNSALASKYVIGRASEKKVVDSTITISKEKPAKGVRVVEELNGEPFTLKGHRGSRRYQFSVVEVNSFPAASLNIEYLFAVTSSLFRGKREIIVNEAMRLVREGQKPIVYIQSKSMIDAIRKRISKEVGEDRIVIIYSSMRDKEKRNMVEKVRTGNYDVALITSSSSRGLSYPHSSAVLIDFQSFEIESGLMEAVQTAFRMRGNPGGGLSECRDKKLVLVVVKPAVDEGNVEDTAIVARKKAMDALLTFTLIRNSILSRIGVSSLNASVIPLGYFSRERITEEYLSNLIDRLFLIAKREREEGNYGGFVSLLDEGMKSLDNYVPPKMRIDRVVWSGIKRATALIPPANLFKIDSSFLSGVEIIDEYKLKEINGFAVLCTTKQSSKAFIASDAKWLDRVKKAVYAHYKSGKISETVYDEIKSILNQITREAEKEEASATETNEPRNKEICIAYPTFALFADQERFRLNLNRDGSDFPLLIDRVFRSTFFTANDYVINYSIPYVKPEIILESMSGLQLRLVATKSILSSYKKRKEDNYIGKIFTVMEM